MKKLFTLFTTGILVAAIKSREVSAQNLGTISTPVAPGIQIGDVVESFIIFGLGTGAVVLLFMLLWGVFQWITSAGEKGALEQARTRMTTSVIGFVLLASIWAVYTIITRLTYTP